ncbi:MAG: helix-turn-helix domain-containing protein [Mycetocola sp.]
MVRVPLTEDERQRGEQLGLLLRQARGDRTIGSIATAAGISPETLRKIETGRIATPSFATIAALAEHLGLSLDTLWSQLGGVGAAEEGATLKDAS